MKNALRVLVFAFAVMLMSAATYAADAPSTTPAPAAAPATGSAATGTTAAPTRHGPCRDDVQNFCSTVPKGHGQILTCLKAHVGQLSPRCEAAMKRHAGQPTSTAPSAPASSAPVTPPAK